MTIGPRVPAEPWETEEREQFRGRFGEAAEVYARTRPVAPSAVFDELVQRVELSDGGSVLEIGPGTGQATRPLAERGLEILAAEIDDRLAAFAAHALADLPNVTVVATSFEQWEPGSHRFDMVFAGNALHWVDPAVRFTKPAALLEPKGALAVMTTPVVIPDHAHRLWWEMQDDWEAVGSQRLDPASKHPDRVKDPAEEIRTSGLFDEPVTRRYPFALTFSADDYVLNLSTQSGVKELPASARAELLDRLRHRISSYGSTVTVHHLAVVTIARARKWKSSTPQRGAAT